MLKLFNTLSASLEDFVPIESGKVRLYVCGPTVYDHAHIGHGRAYVAFDMVTRYLRYLGFDVTYVRNITDIEDKIIQKALKKRVPYYEVSEKYALSFFEDMDHLGLGRPEISPKATETIPEILKLIEQLISKGHAYESNGDVYFSIQTKSDYGKLSKRDPSELKAGARVDPSELKRDPLDFALWKSAKPGEPSWASPWGQGRPGWHIECSAMAKKWLGDSIDIHAGGRDLIFPHHENEIAQSECATGKLFAKYWIHNGFVNLNKEKMSKSLGNFVTLKDLLNRFHPEALKLFLLSSHYRSPIDFSDASVEESAKGLDRMYRVLLSIPEGGDSVREKDRSAFESAMNDDFNSAKAIGVLFEVVKEANRLTQKNETLEEAKQCRRTVIELGKTLGLFQDDPQSYFKRLPNGGHQVEIENLIAERVLARREKNFKRADEIRSELSKKFRVVLEDGPEGTSWRVEGS